MKVQFTPTVHGGGERVVPLVPEVHEFETVADVLAYYNRPKPRGVYYGILLGMNLIGDQGESTPFVAAYRQEFLNFIRQEWEEDKGIDKNPDKLIPFGDATYLFEQIRELDLYIQGFSEPEENRSRRKEFIFQTTAAQLLEEGETRSLNVLVAQEDQRWAKKTLTEWEQYWQKALTDWERGQKHYG